MYMGFASAISGLVQTQMSVFTKTRQGCEIPMKFFHWEGGEGKKEKGGVEWSGGGRQEEEEEEEGMRASMTGYVTSPSTRCSERSTLGNYKIREH